MPDPIVKKSVALSGVEISLVEEFAAEHDVNFSKGLRSIIRRWAGLEDDRFRLTEQGRKALEEAKKE
jgi:hypothetical protein